MLEVSNLITVTVAFFIAAASPGPATLAVATVSMDGGRWSGIKFALGLSVGLAFWGIIAATGVGAVLQTSGEALVLMKLLGGGYLLWLAYKSAQSAAYASEGEIDLVVERREFVRGLLLNLLNPKAVFGWMAVLALGLGDDSSSAQVAAATMTCMVIGLLIYTFYALMFSTSGAMAVYRKIRRWVEGAVAGMFAIAGFGLIRSALIRE
ncbi:MAG: LysE family translocator [Pseudomonadota bacterium]